MQPGFDPARLAVVEHDPGITQSPRAQPGTATYQELRPEDVVVTVHATVPSIVVVRNNYDPGWSATVDGAPATVLATDEFRQGVAVGAGDHVVRLTFRDPSIGKGLRDSAIVWGLLALGIGAALVRERRRRPLRRREPGDLLA